MRTVRHTLSATFAVVCAFASNAWSAPDNLPRAHIEALSYKLALPSGDVTYPNLAQCVASNRLEGVGLVALDDFGVAVLSEGLRALYGPEFAEQSLHAWKLSSSHAPELLVLQALPGSPRTSDALAHPQTADGVRLHACQAPSATPAQRSKVMNMTYELHLPNQDVIYPTMDFCLKGGSFEGSSLIVFNDTGAAVVQAGLHSLYGPTLSEATATQWLTRRNPNSERLATLLALRKSTQESSATRIVAGLTVPLDEPVLVRGCDDAGGGHSPRE